MGELKVGDGAIDRLRAEKAKLGGKGVPRPRVRVFMEEVPGAENEAARERGHRAGCLWVEEKATYETLARAGVGVGIHEVTGTWNHQFNAGFFRALREAWARVEGGQVSPGE